MIKKNFAFSKFIANFAADTRCPKGLNRELGVNPRQFPLLCWLDACHYATV